MLVTGSTRGIGRGIAEKFLSLGAKVAINGRDQFSVQQFANTHKALFPVEGDVSEPNVAKEVVARAIECLGGLDLVVCNVGSGVSVAAGEETYDEWHRVFAVNFFSATNIIEAVKFELRKTKGNIVCVSSICGSEVIPGAPLTYSVAKSALNSYVRGSAKALGKFGVRINAVAPGNVLFDGSVWERKLNEDEYAVMAMLESEVALQRLAGIPDITEAVVWLGTDQSKFVTGTILVVDGGQIRRL